MSSEQPRIVLLDVVTPTANRPKDLLEQAKRLGPQLSPYDRWLIVDDASSDYGGPDEIARAMYEQRQRLLFVSLTYIKRDTIGTVNRARHAGCSLARPDAWIVEIDDHDLVEPDCLDLLRKAILDGGVVLYGDCRWYTEEGQPGDVFRKPDYFPWMLRDSCALGEGVRAYPKALYDAVGGYRWHGPAELFGNEFPAGDYALQLRMEAALGGQGFVRIPQVLSRAPKVVGGISTRFHQPQAEMADRLRAAAKAGTILEG